MQSSCPQNTFQRRPAGTIYTWRSINVDDIPVDDDNAIADQLEAGACHHEGFVTNSGWKYRWDFREEQPVPLYLRPIDYLFTLIDKLFTWIDSLSEGEQAVIALCVYFAFLLAMVGIFGRVGPGYFNWEDV